MGKKDKKKLLDRFIDIAPDEPLGFKLKKVKPYLKKNKVLRWFSVFFLVVVLVLLFLRLVAVVLPLFSKTKQGEPKSNINNPSGIAHIVSYEDRVSCLPIEEYWNTFSRKSYVNTNLIQFSQQSETLKLKSLTTTIKTPIKVIFADLFPDSLRIQISLVDNDNNELFYYIDSKEISIGKSESSGLANTKGLNENNKIEDIFYQIKGLKIDNIEAANSTDDYKQMRLNLIAVVDSYKKGKRKPFRQNEPKPIELVISEEDFNFSNSLDLFMKIENTNKASEPSEVTFSDCRFEK